MDLLDIIFPFYCIFFNHFSKCYIVVLLDGVLEQAEVKELISYVDDVLKILPDSTKIPEIKWEYYIKKIHASIKNKLSQLDLVNTYQPVSVCCQLTFVNSYQPVSVTYQLTFVNSYQPFSV
jgi:hypothetical protein